MEGLTEERLVRGNVFSIAFRREVEITTSPTWMHNMWNCIKSLPSLAQSL